MDFFLKSVKTDVYTLLHKEQLNFPWGCRCLEEVIVHPDIPLDATAFCFDNNSDEWPLYLGMCWDRYYFHFVAATLGLIKMQVIE